MTDITTGLIGGALGRARRHAIRTGRTTSAGSGSQTETEARTEEVQTLLPWLPPQLVDIYVQEWIKTGNPDLAWAKMRQSPAYETHFPGNRLPDGSVLHEEREYLGIVLGFDETLTRWGLNPNAFRKRYGDAIAGGLSPSELGSRIQVIDEELLQRPEALIQWYADNYNIRLTRQAVLAAAIDPEISNDILTRRISAAQVGGSALQAGFAVSRQRADVLARQGVGFQQAQQLYGQARTAVPSISDLARRHFDPADPFTIRDFEQAVVFQDPTAMRRIERLQRAEQSLFTPAAGFAQNQAGALVGLRQQ